MGFSTVAPRQPFPVDGSHFDRFPFRLGKDLCAKHRLSAGQLANFWESLSLQQNLTFGREAIVRFDTFLRTQTMTPIKSKVNQSIKSDPNRSFRGDDDDVMEVDDDDGGFAKAFSPLPKLSQAIKNSPVRFYSPLIYFCPPRTWNSAFFRHRFLEKPTPGVFARRIHI